MTNLPREMQPGPALEERVVSIAIAAGLVRRRRVWPAWAAAAVAAVIALAVGVTMFGPKHPVIRGNTYAVLLYEDSAYTPAPAGHGNERRLELTRWADSLNTLGKYESAGRLVGSGPLGGLFMVRAADDTDAARIAASCPFRKWGGRVVIKRFEQ